MKRKINLQKCNSWDELPEVWKAVKKVRPIEFKDDITDKNLLKIVQEYFSTDDLRPAMTGAFVEKNSITVTDAHKLINIPFNSNLPEGVYRINPKSKNTEVKMYGLIKERYPEYQKILRNSPLTYRISAYKLKTYCQAVINGKYPNNVTKAIIFKYNSEKKVSFNGQFLIDVLDSFLLMGYDELYVSFERGGMYFSPNQETTKNPLKNIGKFPFSIIMELFIGGDDTLGARDIDFETELNAYYCFECDKIFNADGSVANFDINLTNPVLPYMNQDHLKLAEKMLAKNAPIPIIEYVLVKDTKLVASDLDHFLFVKDVYVDDGIYEIVNGALKDTTYEIDDYPRIPDVTEVPLGDFDTAEISKRVSQSISFVGDDSIRPLVNGICLRLATDQNYGKTDMIATNMHILVRSELTSSVVSDGNKQYLIDEPKYLSYFLNDVTDERVRVYGLKTEGDKDFYRIRFDSDSITYNTKTIDAKIPAYEDVIDKNLNTVFEFDADALNQALSSLKGEDAKKNIYFDFESTNRDKGYFKLKLSEYDPGISSTKIVKDLNIKIGCDIKPIPSYPKIGSFALIMPVNTHDRNFSFNVKYLKSVLSVSENRFFFDDRKEAPQFITPILPVPVKSKPVMRIVKPAISTDDIQATIDALQFLADSGNEDAKNTIESLKLLK